MFDAYAVGYVFGWVSGVLVAWWWMRGSRRGSVQASPDSVRVS